jgi:MFS family permease
MEREMATEREIRTVYAAGVAQGIVLVTFPAASTIFTDPSEYGLSNTQYGLLFVPQVVTAISASLVGAGLARRFGTKRIYVLGLAASLVAMGLLLVSTLFESSAFPLLLVATAFLGVGFGMTVPALNTLTAAFHPKAVESSVLTLNALLGPGTTLAPVFVAIFVGLGFWWGLPLTSAVLLTALLAASLGLPLRVVQSAAGASRARRLPNRFWIFAVFAVVYGVCETVNGAAPRSCRSRSASARKSSRRSLLRWPAGSSPSTSSATASPRSGSGRCSTQESGYRRSTRRPPGSPSLWVCSRSRWRDVRSNLLGGARSWRHDGGGPSPRRPRELRRAAGARLGAGRPRAPNLASLRASRV